MVAAISHQGQHPHLHAHHHHHQDHLCHHHESHAHFLPNQPKCTFTTASSSEQPHSQFLSPSNDSSSLKTRQDSLPPSPNSYSSSPTSSTCNLESTTTSTTTLTCPAVTTATTIAASSSNSNGNCTIASTSSTSSSSNIPLMTKHYDSSSDSPCERQRPCQPFLC